MTATFAWAALALAAHVHAWFAVSVFAKRNDVADVAWGLGFVLLAWTGVAAAGPSARSLLVAALVTAWGVRLASHIARRNAKKSEDPRYVELIGASAHPLLRAYAVVFLLQGALLFVVALPVLLVGTAPGAPLTALDAVGAAVWVLGFAIESIADRQLRNFLRDPANKGRVMDRGLWRYSRHPNYFGEVTQWWGIGIIALSVPYGAAGLVGPLAITLLILFVSGIPPLEKRHAGRPEYADYNRRTSVFVPWFPKT